MEDAASGDGAAATPLLAVAYVGKVAATALGTGAAALAPGAPAESEGSVGELVQPSTAHPPSSAKQAVW